MEDTTAPQVSYSDALDHWDRSRAFGDTRDFPQFANDMETLHPGQGFGAAAQRDGWWTRLSTRLDQNVFNPIAEKTTAPVGEAIGGLFGEGGAKVGREVGMGIPRTVAQLAPLAIPGVGEAYGGALAAGILGTEFGAQTYAETGSPKAALISGATAGLLPTVSRIGGAVAPRVLGVTATESPFAFKAAQFAGSQTAMVGANEASMYGVDKATGQKFDPLDPHFLATQLPWTAWDLVKTARATVPTGEVVAKPTERTTTKYTPPEVSQPEADATIEATLKNLQTAYADPTTPSEVREASLAAANALIQNPAGVTGAAKAGRTAESPTEITGYGREHLGGNWKVLQLDPETGQDKTVWVNGVEPTKNADGTLTFAAKPSQISDNVTSPLKREDFGIPAHGQESLPEQSQLWQGFAADQQRTLEENGVVKPPENEDVKQTLRETADSLQQAQEQESNARTKVAAVPQSAEEIPQILGDVEAAKPHIDEAIKSGATPTQAVEKARLSTQTPAVDEAMQQLAIAREQAKTISTLGGEYTANKPQAIYGDYIRNEDGENFPTRGFAEAYRDAHPEYEGYTVRAAGKGGEGFYLGRQINKEVSLEGTKLEKVLVDPSGSTALESRPDVSFEAALQQIDRASQSPRIFANEAGFDDVSDAILALRQARVVMPLLREGQSFEKIQAALAEAKVAGFTSPRNAVAVMQSVRDGLAGFQDVSRNFALDSKTPFDQKLVDSIGVLHPTDGLKNVLSAYINSTDPATADIRELLGRIFAVQGANGVQFKVDPHVVSPQYDHDNGVISTNYLPTQENLAKWNAEIAHEYLHDVTKGLRFRTDPAAVQLKAIIAESRETLMKSPMLPKEIRDVIPKAIQWYKEFATATNADASQEFYDKWHSAVGDGKDEWLHVVYGLSHEDELLPSLFNSQKLLEVATKTQATGPERSTVLQKISTWFNRMFGGKPESDSVLAKLLTGFDQYLSGSKVPPRDVAVGPTLSAGENFFYGLAGYNPTTNVLGGKHKLPNSGVVSEQQLKSIGGIGKPLSDGEVELYKSLVPEAWDAGKVNVPKLVAGLKEKGPVVAVNVRQSYNGRDFLRDSLIATGVRPEALASRIDTIQNLFNTGSLQHSIDGFSREMADGTLPATAETGPLKPELTTALTSGEPKEVRTQGLSLLANEVPVHQELLQRMKEDVDTAVKLYSNIKKGLIPGDLPPNSREALQQAHVRVDALGQALDKQARDISRFNDLSNFTLDGMEQTRVLGLSSDRLPAPPDPTELQKDAQELLGLVDARRETSRAVLERGKAAGAANWVRKTFMFTQYLKQIIPQVRPAFDHIFQLQGETNFWKNELDAVYGMDPKNVGEMDKARVEANRRVATNETLMRAASDIKLWNQTEEAAGRTPSLDDPFVKNTLARFNPKDRNDILSEANNARAVHDHWTEVTAPRFLARKNMLTVAKIIALREQGMPPEQARDLAGQFSSAIDQLKDPQQAQGGLELLQTLRGSMQPNTYLAAFGLAKGLADDTTEHLNFMRSRPNYVTEQRIDGKHAIRMVTPENKPYFNTFGSKPDALAAVKRLEAKGYKYLEYIPAQDLNVPYRGVNEDVIGKLRELDLQRQNREATALQGLDSSIAATTLSAFNRANDYEESLAAFSPVPGAAYPQRHFVAGREELNMVQQQNMFYGRATNWMRHQLTRAETELDLLHPDLLADREATKLVRDHVGNVLTPDSQLARKMAEFTYNWKLAGNFGVNALHLVQSLNTGMASLIAETGGVGDALALTVGAQKAVIQRALSGKWASVDHDWLDKRAAAEGVAGFATWEGDVGDANRNALQYASTPTWQKPFEALKYAARSWNGMFFKFNDRIGLISAFDLGRSRGMDYDEAYNFARDVKNQGYFTGGKAQRSVNQWAAFGPQAKAVPQLMSSLQTYVQGWFSLLASNYIKGFGKSPEGLTSVQISGAKKAFLYQLGAQAVLAGALGLPGVGQGMALVKQSTGVDVMSWLRQHLGELFDEDQVSGGLMTTLALHGATAAFTPVDTSGRHMPSVPYIGVTPYKGFDLSNLAGAPVSSAADLVKGLMAATKGDTQGMASLLPEVLKGPLRLWQSEGDVRDKGGNLITRMSPSEQFVTALGMKPSRITALQDIAVAVKEANQRAAAEKNSVVDQLATVYRKNGVDQGHTALIQYLQQHPNEDGKSLVRAVSAKVQAQTTVPDWSQKANVAANLSGLGGEATSQAQRYFDRQDTEQSLGLYQRPSSRQQMLMSKIDELRSSDPYLSVQEAASLVRSQRPRRPSPFALQSESL